MYFRGLGTATPPARYTKEEALDAFQKSDWFARLDARAHFVARTVLQRDNAIETRRLAGGQAPAAAQRQRDRRAFQRGAPLGRGREHLEAQWL